MACLALVLLTSGCFGESDPTLPVSGTITLNGVPLKHGDIEFSQNTKGGYRSGATIADGKYQTAPGRGLYPGEYLVRIFSVEVPDAAPPIDSEVSNADERKLPPQVDLIPAKYNMRSKELVTVTADGPNVFDYQIDTGRK